MVDSTHIQFAEANRGLISPHRDRRQQIGEVLGDTSEKHWISSVQTNIGHLDLRLQAAEYGAEAVVDPASERQAPVGATPDVEHLRPVELTRVPVGRACPASGATGAGLWSAGTA